MSLRQTHDTIETRFKHGPHAGASVADLIRRLLQGCVSIVDLTLMVAVCIHNELWKVFNCRKLKAKKDAMSQGLSETHIPCITHNLNDKSLADALPLSCKFLDAWSTRNDRLLAEFRHGRQYGQNGGRLAACSSRQPASRLWAAYSQILLTAALQAVAAAADLGKCWSIFGLVALGFSAALLQREPHFKPRVLLLSLVKRI